MDTYTIIELVMGIIGVLIAFYVSIRLIAFNYFQVKQFGKFISLKEIKKQFELDSYIPLSRDEMIINVVEKGDNLAILGEYGSGKTVLIHNTLLELSKNKEYRDADLLYISSDIFFRKLPVFSYKKYLFFQRKFVILVFDDISRYAENPLLFDIVEKLQKASRKIQILCATTNFWWETKNSTPIGIKLNAIFPKILSLPKLHEVDVKTLSERFAIPIEKMKDPLFGIEVYTPFKKWFSSKDQDIQKTILKGLTKELDILREIHKEYSTSFSQTVTMVLTYSAFMFVIIGLIWNQEIFSTMKFSIKFILSLIIALAVIPLMIIVIRIFNVLVYTKDEKPTHFDWFSIDVSEEDDSVELIQFNLLENEIGSSKDKYIFRKKKHKQTKILVLMYIVELLILTVFIVLVFSGVIV